MPVLPTLNKVAARAATLGRRRRLKGAPGRGTQAKDEPIIWDSIAPGTLVHTDEYDIYVRLPAWGYRHKMVCHAHGKYAHDEDCVRPIVETAGCAIQAAKGRLAGGH